MLAFYLSFWRKHRDVLIGGRLYAANPESAYSLVRAEKDGRAVFTAYTDTVIDCAAYRETVAVNASRHPALILKGASGAAYSVLDCMGNLVKSGTVRGSLDEIDVPFCGMVRCEKT